MHGIESDRDVQRLGHVGRGLVLVDDALNFRLRLAEHWPWAADTAVLDTPPARWGVDTGRENILLCGSGARRGGAVSGLGGHNAAQAVLELALARRRGLPRAVPAFCRRGTPGGHQALC